MSIRSPFITTFAFSTETPFLIIWKLLIASFLSLSPGNSLAENTPVDLPTTIDKSVSKAKVFKNLKSTKNKKKNKILRVIEKSDLIFEGEVEKISYFEKDNHIFSEVVYRVDRVVKGSLDSNTYTFTVQGGEAANGEIEFVRGAHIFNEKDKDILFIIEKPDFKNSVNIKQRVRIYNGFTYNRHGKPYFFRGVNNSPYKAKSAISAKPFQERRVGKRKFRRKSRGSDNRTRLDRDLESNLKQMTPANFAEFIAFNLKNDNR